MRGRAADPEKEAARREKIRASMREYAKVRVRDAETGKWGKAPLEGQWQYVVRSRERKKSARSFGWDYFSADIDEYGLELDDDDFRELMNRLHPKRRYYKV